MHTTASPHSAEPPAADGPADIVLVSELYPPAVGGSGVLLSNVYERFERHRVSVLTDCDTSPGREEYRGRVHMYRRRFASRRWGVFGFRSLRDHWRTARTIQSIPRERSALIHCARALPEATSTLLGFPLIRRRYLCWTHGEELTTARLSREFTLLTRLVLSRAAAVYANSYNTLRLLEEFGIPREQVAVVRPAVDAARFRPDVDGNDIRRRYAPSGEFLICTVGRFERRKGHDHAIEVIAALRQQTPRVRYVIVGDGPERPRLESLVQEFGVRNCVEFVGKVAEADLPAFFAACDVFLHPNRIYNADSEGFGIVFLEAQASGKPVVGGRSGGVPETMVEGETGFLVSGEDVGETVSVLRRFVDDPDLGRRMGIAGQRHVVTNFTWTAAARAAEEVHEQVLKSGTLRAARMSG